LDILWQAGLKDKNLQQQQETEIAGVSLEFIGI